MTSKANETYYDILKVHPRASIAEIVQAYHTAKNAFSKDSVATYSLFSAEETQEVLGKLEEAYLTLSNIDKKKEYDKHLAGNSEVDFTSISQFQAKAQSAMKEEVPKPSIVQEITPPAPAAPTVTVDSLSGGQLKEIREKRGLSVEDVSRITKIPNRFLQALEGDDLKKLPARVYIQGFVKNLAGLYKLDPATAVKSFLNHIDSKTAEMKKV